jgi:hypothetical protein
MRINPIVFPLALVIVSPLWANWGSDAGGSVGTGSFHAFGTDQVEMENENLEIRLFHDRAKVQVEYILTNTGSELDVRAGFPCLGLGSGSGAAKCVEVEDYQLEANGVLVPFQTEKGDVKNWKQLFGEDFLYMSERIAEDYGELIPRMLWLTSTVHFGKGESKRKSRSTTNPFMNTAKADGPMTWIITATTFDTCYRPGEPGRVPSRKGR